MPVLVSPVKVMLGAVFDPAGKDDTPVELKVPVTATPEDVTEATVDPATCRSKALAFPAVEFSPLVLAFMVELGIYSPRRLASCCTRYAEITAGVHAVLQMATTFSG